MSNLIIDNNFTTCKRAFQMSIWLVRLARKEMSMSKYRMPVVLFCGAAFLSFLLSVYLWFTGQKEEGVFVGLWVPSILSLGALMLAGRRVNQ